MKKRFFALLPLLFCLLLPTTPAVAAQSVDDIVAVVNDQVILASELQAAVHRARANMGQRAANIPANILESRVLDRLIMTRLQVERAKKAGLNASDSDVKQGIARLARQNNTTPQQFLQSLESDGVPLAAVKQQVRQNILIQKIRGQEVSGKITVTDNDVSRFLQSQSLRDQGNREYHLRHIRLNIPEGADAEALHKRMEDIRDKAVSGEVSFADLARTWSDGDNASRGGDMGWVGNAFMPRVFTDIVPDLDDGQVSQVFRGGGAFHLVKLLGTRGSGTLAGDQKVMVHEVELQHIVLQPNTVRDDRRTRDLAAEIEDRLKAGGDFSELAEKYSDDKTSANQGGRVGWVQPKSLPSRQAAQVTQMQPGEISPIIPTSKGYAILKVLDRREQDKTREAIRRRARQILGQRKSEEKGRRWLHELRSNAYVDIRLKGYQSSNG